ncbi:peptidoglycan-binding domain-containing protein [Methylobacterium sp. J-076]|uniref:peptidoglycan-binding domain-containing protein n=1 Tax=Methylobacterium sp. J-076 TaxID=2836655 RepID=UPI001FB96BAB|nr:peptidoglycan-binding domain-containing protein [Methylobacterium sp. J-076]MCJ2014570.1 peptidoglycan-binding protein [Methylobacterium sp. J-076]
MAGYREITVAGDGRPRRPAREAGRAVPSVRQAGWRGVAMQLLRSGLAEGKVQCRERPGSVFGAAVAVAAAGFICVNALDSQKGRHPAPILPKVAPKLAAKAPPAPAAAAPAPVRDVVAKEPAPAPKQAAGDTIGELIRAEDTTASVNPRAKPAPAKAEAKAATPAAPAADQAVMRAQRALAKLGYGPVKTDGAMGPATKAAIEKFERDRKLPVTGEAAGKTLRALETGAAKG